MTQSSLEVLSLLCKKMFLWICRNSWLSQQISLNSNENSRKHADWALAVVCWSPQRDPVWWIRFGINSSLSSISSPCQSSGNHSYRLFQKTIKGLIANLLNQWQSSWGSALEQLALVRRASTNTGSFLVCEGKMERKRVKMGLKLLTGGMVGTHIWEMES